MLGETKRQNDDIERLLKVTRNAAVGHQDAAKMLIDCNTPGGECFKREQRRVAGYLASIARDRQRDIVAAFVCNDRPGGKQVRELTACIDDLLKRR